MSHTFRTIFLRYPAKNFATSVIIKVGINIRQRDTVRIQETLEQQIVFNRVDLGNSQTISYSRTGSRTTARSYRNAQFFPGSPDKILYNQEVTRETHRLHDMQLEVQTFLDFVRQWITIAGLCSFIRQLGQIISFQLDTV